MSKSNGITRKTSTVAVVMSGTAAASVTTPAINYEDYASGGFAITSTAAYTGAPLVAFKVCDTSTGTYMNLYGSTGNLIEVSAAVNKLAYALPDELKGWPYFKMWLQTNGTAIAQASIKSFIVVLMA